jgi:DNA polymerase III subunit delta
MVQHENPSTCRYRLLKPGAQYVKIGLAIYREGNLLYIFWGEDEFSIEETLSEIKHQLGDASLLSTNTNVLDGQNLTLNDLKAVGAAMPFLVPKRLVIIKGLLERFEPKDKSGRPKKSNSTSAKQDGSQLLADCILGFPESTILVFTDSIEVKKPFLQNNPLFNSISGKAETRSFPVLKGTKLFQWIESRVNRQSGSISRQATNLLMETIGGDLHSMANEINKLVAFTGGRLIEEKDVKTVVSASQEADIFAMIDAIMDRKTGTAEKILQKLLLNGRMPPEILALLARQIQLLVQIKELKFQKRPAMEIQGKIGIYNSFAWEKMSTRAGKYSRERLKEIYLSLLQTDLSIKTGRLDGDLALNLLVAELSEKPE